MRAVKYISFAAVVAATLLVAAGLEAGFFRRHYYSRWSHYPERSYHYSYYYYKPYASYAKYDYHYCVYYPSRPNYVYYYNPYQKVYWGRYDLEQKGYSTLAEADRKPTLGDIPEEAFPEPSKMPAIPESEDGETMAEPPQPPTETPEGDAPEGERPEGQDAPGEAE